MNLADAKSALSGGMHPVPTDPRYKKASVLVAIYGAEPAVIMTEKPKGMRFHAGEISFPGGKPDAGDTDLLDTALRETREEIGLAVSRDQVAGQLRPVITLNSGFSILPFVAVLDDIPPLAANCEVEQIFHIPLGPLLKTMARDSEPSHNKIQEMYTFEYSGNIVWGASARILQQIRERLK